MLGYEGKESSDFDGDSVCWGMWGGIGEVSVSTLCGSKLFVVSLK